MAVDRCSGGEELRSYATTEVLAFLTRPLKRSPSPNLNPSPTPSPSPSPNPSPTPNPNPNQVLAFVASRRVGCSLEPRSVAPFAALCIDPPATPAAAVHARAAAVGSAALHFVVTSRNAEVHHAGAWVLG